MQGSTSSAMATQPEAILEWLQREMGYRPTGHYLGPGRTGTGPSVEAIRRVCRGNMIPVWSFLLQRVKSERTAETIRRNILVHGGGGGDGERRGPEESVGRRRESERGLAEAVQEREAAEKEVERLRQILRRQRKELKAKMLEVSKEEAERKRMLDDRANLRFCCVRFNCDDQILD